MQHRTCRTGLSGWPRIASALAFSVATTLPAQDVIPVRALPAATVISNDTLSYRVTVRPLSDGRVLVNDVPRFRVLLFDKQLKRQALVIDSATSLGASTFEASTLFLIPATGDTTLWVDYGSRSLLLIDPDGRVVRPVALMRPNDVTSLSFGNAGKPVWDARGRLVYRGGAAAFRPTTNGEIAEKLLRVPFFDELIPLDSAPLVRADFDTRTIDTITTINVRSGTVRVRYTREQDGNVTRTTTIDPFDPADEWAMLPNGTIAIVRAHDYHIDWVDPDGTKRSTPKMPLDWKRITDEEKQSRVNAKKPEYERLSAMQPPERLSTSFGPRRITSRIELVAPDALPDYEPPLSPGAVMPDLEGNLWIVPRTAISDGASGIRYDVVNAAGRIVERVTLPKGRRIAAFEPGGTVILSHSQAGVTVLERAPLR